MADTLAKRSKWRPGVSLRPDLSGGRVWVQNIKIDNKPRIVELGRFPDIGLPEARERAAQNSQKVASGVNILSTLRRSHEQYLKQQIAALNTRLKSDAPEGHDTPAEEVPAAAEHTNETAPTPRAPLVRRKASGNDATATTPETAAALPAAGAPPAPADAAEPTNTQSPTEATALPHENIRGRNYFS